jgi:hypothetical protein
MSGFDPNSEEFAEKGTALIFNDGNAGVKEKCLIKIEKKTETDSPNGPDYKLYGWDQAQVENNLNLEQDRIYPVNKGFFKRDEFNSKAAERFAINELKHLLKITGHKVDDKDSLVFDRSFESPNDFMDYTMHFMNSQLNANPSWRFDLVVDYGNKDFPKKFLQLNGYPWYICKSDTIKLQNKRDVLMEKLEFDDEEVPFKKTSNETISDEDIDAWK